MPSFEIGVVLPIMQYGAERTTPRWAVLREIVPIVESEIAQDAQRWRLLKADLTRESQLGDRCGVQIIPMLIAFVNGKPVSQLDGAATALRVRKFLEAIPSDGP